MKVFIIVLTYNNYVDTRECLCSLQQLDYEEYELMVVDNGSSDDSIEALKAEFPDIIFLESKVNLGYSGGANLGLEYALKNGADYIWLLNNDTVVDKSSLMYLIEATRTYPGAGMIGSKIYYYSDPRKINYAGGRISRVTGWNIHEGSGDYDDDRFNETKRTTFVNGASAFINADMLNDIGLLDEALYFYYEDTDLSIRATNSGWELVFEPRSKVWHKIAQTIGPGNPDVTYYMTRNSLYLCNKHKPLCLPFSIIINLRYSVINHLIKYILMSCAKEELEHAKMAIKGFTDFFLKRMGKFCN